MTTITNKLLKALALVWVSVFGVLIILFVATPGEGALINALWLAQISLTGLWAILYCVRGAVFVSEGVAERKKATYRNTGRD